MTDPVSDMTLSDLVTGQKAAATADTPDTPIVAPSAAAPVTPPPVNTQKESLQFNSDFTDHFRGSQNNELIEKYAPQLAEGVKQSETEQQQRDENGLSFTDKAGQVAGAVASDVTKGIMSAPRSIGRGAGKGVNEMLSFLDMLHEVTPTLTPIDKDGNVGGMPGLVLGKEGDRRLDLAKQNKAKADGTEYTPNPDPQITPIPVLDAPKVDSVTGKGIEAISQFLTGWGAIGKAGKLAEAGKLGEGALATSAKWLNEGGTISNAVKGTLSEVLSFDKQDQRLSNVIQEVPALQNPVTAYLQSKPGDSAAEATFKQAAEGLLTNGVGEMLFKGISLLKRGKEAEAAVKAEGKTTADILGDGSLEQQAGVRINDRKLADLGDAENPSLILEDKPVAKDIAGDLKTQGNAGENAATAVNPADAKLTKAAKRTAGMDVADISPENVPATFRINFARIDGPEQVAQLMQDVANHPQLMADISEARRGKVSDEQLLKNADDVDGFATLMDRRVGQGLNDAQTIAARKVYYDSTEKLLELANKVAGPDATDVDAFAFRKMMAVHHAVQQEIMGARAEQARALRAWSLPIAGSDASRVKALEDVLNEYGGSEATKDLAKRMAALSKDGALNTSQINQLTNGGALARTQKALQEVWTMGLLTSPRTHVVNIASNFMTGLSLGLERAGMSVWKDSPVGMREAVEYYLGYFGSFKEALSNGAKAWKTGETGMGLGKIDLPATRATSRAVLDPNGRAGFLSKAIDWYGAGLNKAVGGGLAFGDEMAKTMLYKGQVRALAAREAKAMGLEGEEFKGYIANALDNPSSAIHDNSVNFAEMGTYTESLQGNAKAMQRLIQKVPGMRYVVPFVRTPINIFKYTFERTPLGLLSQNMRDDLTAGGLRGAQAMTKLSMGSGAMFLGFDLSMNGHITGQGPRDPKVVAKLRATGWQPYSIKIGDKYHSYARFEPFATWLGMSSDMAEIMGNYEAYDIQAQDEADEMVTAAITSMANQFVGKTFMSGISDIMETISDPKRYGEALLQKYAGSFVPNVVNDIRQIMDPSQKQVFNLMDAVKARVPGLSDSVPDRFNVYGEKIKAFYPDPDSKVMATVEGAARLFNPVYSTDKDMPHHKLDDWFLQNGIDGPNMPNKVQSFEVPGSLTRERVAINLRDYPQAYSRMSELRGKTVLPQYHNMTMQNYLGALVDRKVPDSLAFYSMMKDRGDQNNMVSKIVSDYDTKIRSELLDEFPVLRQAVQVERLRQADMNKNTGTRGLVDNGKAFP